MIMPYLMYVGSRYISAPYILEAILVSKFTSCAPNTALYEIDATEMQFRKTKKDQVRGKLFGAMIVKRS